MEAGLFILGLLLGAGVAWFLIERYRQDRALEIEANYEVRLKHLQDELKQADSAHNEMKERLIALQMEHKALQERVPLIEAELARVKETAEQAAAAEIKAKEAVEQARAAEAKANETVTTLRAEIDRLQQQLKSSAVTAKPVTAAGTSTPAAAPSLGTAGVSGAVNQDGGGVKAVAPDGLPSEIIVPAAGLGGEFRDDLTKINSIGKRVESKLNELGITTYKQIAELSPDDIHRINRALAVPGQVERERWVEQARTLSGAGEA